jgi:hypothetical protein
VSTELDRPDPGIDLAEIARRRWVAEEMILEDGRLLAEFYDLDPSLVEDIEEAVDDQDHDAFLAACVPFLRALVEAGATVS